MQKMSRKSIFVFILLVAILLLFPTFVQAADSESSITYTKEFPGSDGTIIFNLKGLNLDETGEYVYSLTTQSGSAPEEKDWVNISDYTPTTARIELKGAEGKFTETMAKTNKAIIWIKKTDETSENAIKVNVDLTLSPETVPSLVDGGNPIFFKSHEDDIYSFSSYIFKPLYVYRTSKLMWTTYYGYLNKIEYNFVKVNDKKIVEEWLKYKENIENNKDANISSIYNEINNSKLEIPTTGYSTCDESTSYGESGCLSVRELGKRQDGLYIIYLRYSGEGYKTVYGYTLYDGMYDTATTFDEYKKHFDNVDSDTDNNDNTNKEDTQKTELTATVSYNPSTSTTGNVTATIKTNKKVKNVSGWTLSSDGKTLTKKYSKNTTEIVNLVAEDESEKSVTVKITNIKAEDTNKDKNNNNSNTNGSVQGVSKDDDDDNKPSTGSSSSSSKNTTTGKKDNTVSPTILPQTGLGRGIMVIVIIATVYGIYAYRKYNYLKDIK